MASPFPIVAPTKQYDVGDEVWLSVAFTYLGRAADPTAVVFKLKLPDGTLVTYTYGTDVQVVRDAVGSYHVAYPIAQVGTHSYRYEGSGTVKAAAERKFVARASAFY